MFLQRPPGVPPVVPMVRVIAVENGYLVQPLRDDSHVGESIVATNRSEAFRLAERLLAEWEEAKDAADAERERNEGNVQ